MHYLPIHLSVRQQACLIVGGGEVAVRKASTLARAGAKVSVVAPKIRSELVSLVEDTEGICIYRAFIDDDVMGHRLVIAATEIEAVNQEVYQACVDRQVWVNVVDDPARCQFIFPAIVDRDPLILTVSSSGQAPVLARYLRAKIETWVPKRYDKLAQLAGQFRTQVKQTLKSGTQRRRFWESVFSGKVVETVLKGHMQTAERELQQQLELFSHQESQVPTTEKGMGEVYLVGAGPGDPDLLTFKALRLMQQSDVVIYDRLVSAEIMDLVRRDATRIYAGKKRDEHTIPQAEINELLIQLAKEGRRVCRLKGGDPFIFGRGGEEIEQLAAHAVPFQVVPGITAASGCSSYAGIPLTHRDYAQSVRFVTGHMKDGHLDLPWSSYVTEGETLVFYMGLISLPVIVTSLLQAGRQKQCPVAVVASGTCTNQQVVLGTLENIEDRVISNQIKPPAMLIIGQVVSLHSKLTWYQPSKPVN